MNIIYTAPLSLRCTLNFGDPAGTVVCGNGRCIVPEANVAQFERASKIKPLLASGKVARVDGGGPTATEGQPVIVEPKTEESGGEEETEGGEDDEEEDQPALQPVRPRRARARKKKV